MNRIEGNTVRYAGEGITTSYPDTGHWVIGGELGLKIKCGTRPSWLHRTMMRLCLGIEWRDGPPIIATLAPSVVPFAKCGLQQCRDSGQMEADQVVAHQRAGELPG